MARAAREVEQVRRLLAPRQRDEPVEIGPRDRVLGGRGRHLAEPVELSQRFLLRLLGHLRRLDLLAELIELPGAVVGLAELLLDGLQLLAQVVLALALAHLGLHLRLDLRAQLEDLDLLGERGDQRAGAAP